MPAERRFPPELLLLVLLGVGYYLAPLAVLPLRGEETRRALLAREMVETGDWIVLQEQRQPFLESAPLYYWMVAGSAVLHGEFSRWAVRLPSALAVLATMLVVYWHGRATTTRFAAFVSAASVITMLGILDSGVVAEIEAVFILFVASSLLVWHIGHTRGWHPSVTWAAGYGLAALGMLTKGFQAPVYFVGGVGAYLVLRRDWRTLFHPGHVVGMGCFGLVMLVWFVPLYLQEGWAGIQLVLFERSTSHFSAKWAALLEHLWHYPLEHLLNLMPGSFVLLAYLSPRVRNGLGPMRATVLFCLACLAIAFPTCWLAATARPRYFRPLYPCVAVLVGIAFDRLVAEEALWIHVRRTAVLLAGAMLVAVGGVVAFTWFDVFPERLVPPPTWMAATYVALMTGLAAVVVVAVRERSPSRAVVAMTISSLAVGLTGRTVVDHVQAHLLRDMGRELARVEAIVPEDATLVSLGPVSHRFTFHYPQPIPIRSEDADHFTWFCLQGNGRQPELPFDWERVAIVGTDRNHKRDPAEFDQWVIVGRRLPGGRVAEKNDAAIR